MRLIYEKVSRVKISVKTYTLTLSFVCFPSRHVGYVMYLKLEKVKHIPHWQIQNQLPETEM